MQFTHEQAWDLLKEYNQEPFHLRHALTVEAVMGWFADALGYGEQAESACFTTWILNSGPTRIASRSGNCWRLAARTPR